MTRTAILLHNMHPEAKGWEENMWGIPAEDKLGRIPKALSLLRQFEAEALFFGGGGMLHPKTSEDVAEKLFSYIKNRWNRLKEFSEFQGQNLEHLYERFMRVSDLSLRSSSTREEVASAFLRCEQRGFSQLILVSSPSHSPRCLRDADGLRLGHPSWRSIMVIASSSDVYYQGSDAQKVVILEHPHQDEPAPELGALHNFACFIISRFLGENAEGRRRILKACESLELTES